MRCQNNTLMMGVGAENNFEVTYQKKNNFEVIIIMESKLKNHREYPAAQQYKHKTIKYT